MSSVRSSHKLLKLMVILGTPKPAVSVRSVGKAMFSNLHSFSDSGQLVPEMKFPCNDHNSVKHVA